MNLQTAQRNTPAPGLCHPNKPGPERRRPGVGVCPKTAATAAFRGGRVPLRPLAAHPFWTWRGLVLEKQIQFSRIPGAKNSDAKTRFPPDSKRGESRVLVQYECEKIFDCGNHSRWVNRRHHNSSGQRGCPNADERNLQVGRTAIFDITPDADLTVSLEIVGYRPPPFCFAPDPLMPRKAFSSTGSISVMAYVTNRQNRQVASYLLTDRLYGEILPPDISGPLQRIAERVAKSMKAEFGSM